MSWNSSIETLSGVGKQRANLFKRVGVETVSDLLTYYPREYEDRRNVIRIKEVTIGELVTIKATVCTIPQNIKKRGLMVTKVKLKDTSGFIFALWFGQSYMKNNLKLGEEYFFTGKVSFKYGQMQLQSPDFIKSDQEESTSIFPLYPLTSKLSQKVVRNLTKQALSVSSNVLVDFIPESIREKYHLAAYNFAIDQIHYPDNYENLELARKRIVFEEFYILQVGLMQIKNILTNKKEGFILNPVEEEEAFLYTLPFTLTQAQNKVWDEIKGDLASKGIMNRLVQGDVGSGKTIIALLGLLQTVKNGFQGALMVPTEVLAKQHFEEATKLLAPFNIRLALLVGSVTKKNKEKIYEQLESGEIDVVIGTHAVIQDALSFKALGLVITDEQHRFGVRQRTALAEKNNKANILVMTATPIPRTLALILYGDLDISIIDELPPGRQVIKTYSVSKSYHQRIYNFIREQVDEGRQAYIICPMVEESDEQSDLKAVVQYTEYLQGEVFDLPIAYLHGKQKAKEKNDIITRFANNEIKILVSTTVVEVGVNVPNATVMLIENAERFGLAQLHQLRGRVGRGKHQSYCVLITDSKNDVTAKRMKIMTESNDGFQLSEVDLSLRGPGDVFGLKQHGLPNFKVANIYENMGILKEAQEAAKETIKLDPRLEKESNKDLKQRIDAYFKDSENYVTL